MTKLLHWATHRIPGVPAHVERPAGHQGTAEHGPEHRAKHGRNHQPGRPPRFLPGWQRRVAALFGQEI